MCYIDGPLSYRTTADFEFISSKTGARILVSVELEIHRLQYSKF